MEPRATIYAVDDHEELNEVVEEILSDAGYSVRSFCNARPALEALVAGARPDLVLLDWRLPGINGQEFIAALEHRGVVVRVLVFTAALKDVPLSLHARLAGTLAKPCSLEGLLEAVERAIRTPTVPATHADAHPVRSDRTQRPVSGVRPLGKLRLVV